MNDNNMVVKLAAACRFALVDTLLKVFITRFLQNYLYGVLSSNSFPKINSGYFPMNDNQDGCKNGRHLSVCSCGHSNLVIYHPISSKFHIWNTFIKILFMSEYWFCLTTINKDCRQNGYPLSTAGHYARPFVGVRLF